jgi:hypothetical protein
MKNVKLWKRVCLQILMKKSSYRYFEFIIPVTLFENGRFLYKQYSSLHCLNV